MAVAKVLHPKLVSPVAAKLPSPAVAAKEALSLPPITSIRKGSGIELSKAIEQSAGDGIASSFPSFADIKTTGRTARGFRLDGGSLRDLWLSARRFVDQNGKKGSELFFFAGGELLAGLEERLTKLKAKEAKFVFRSAEPKSDGLHAKKTVENVGDDSSARRLEKAGQYSLEYVPGSPEALRGAVRIRLFGSPTEQQKSLEMLIGQVGLHGVFSPPSPAAIQRAKGLAMLRHHDYDAIKKLTARKFSEVPNAKIQAAVKALDDSSGMDAIDEVKIKGEVKTRVQLARLLLERDPLAFVEWAEGYYYGSSGILPNEQSSHDYGTDRLNTALKEAGVSQSSPAYKAAKKSIVEEADARRVLMFGLLARDNTEAARALLHRDPMSIDPKIINEALKTAGLTPAKIDKALHKEVYPGYFTVVDPSLAERCRKAGARYLYSTYDDAERVVSALTSGQKSSLTRFSEGLIIGGKSSSADFNSGGALAVFTRLVTQSEIGKAEKEAKKAKGKEKDEDDSYYSYSSYSDHEFNNWGGSRPYKLILSTDLLGRTDWWGFNGDNFGQNTDLDKENFGEAIIKEIDKNYSDSNELMFPIGNDPAYVEHVACETQDEKKKLVEAMKEAGIKSWKGKSLSSFIIVSKRLFALPE